MTCLDQLHIAIHLIINCISLLCTTYSFRKNGSGKEKWLRVEQIVKGRKRWRGNLKKRRRGITGVEVKGRDITGVEVKKRGITGVEVKGRDITVV